MLAFLGMREGNLNSNFHMIMEVQQLPCQMIDVMCNHFHLEVHAGWPNL